MSTSNIGIVVSVKNRAGKAFKEIEKNLENVKSKTEAWNKKFANTFDSLKTGGTIIAGVGASLGFLAKGWIDVSAEAEETQSKFNTVFAGIDKEMNDWSNSFAGAVGRSKNEIKGFSAELADVLKPMGLTTQEASNMSKKMTELALDVASFNNKQDVDVINAFKSALTGERESLKSLGIVINEADVKNEAYRLGLARQGQELTKTAKAQATMSLLYANTADAQGDLARTGGSYTNSVKSMNAAMLDLRVELGTALLPIMTPIVQKITELTRKFSGLSPATKNLVSKIVLATAAFAAIGGPILLLLGFLPSIVSGLSLVGGAFTLLLGPIGVVIGAVSAMVLAWNSDFMGIRTTILEFGNFLGGKLFEFVQWFSDAWGAISTNTSMFWDSLKTSTVDTLTGIGEFLGNGLFNFISSVSNFFTEFGEMWKTGWTAVKDYFVDTWENIIENFKKVYEKIMSIVSKIKNAAKSVGKTLTDFGGGLGEFIYDSTHSSSRAFGGQIDAGRPVLVGERGPEVVTFPQSGKILNNAETFGKSQEISINLNFSGNSFSDENQFLKIVQIAKSELVRELELKLLGA